MVTVKTADVKSSQNSSRRDPLNTKSGLKRVCLYVCACRRCWVDPKVHYGCFSVCKTSLYYEARNNSRLVIWRLYTNFLTLERDNTLLVDNVS